MTAKLLGIYLNDHLAGATAGTELARRACANNEGTALGRHLAGLVKEIEEDRARLESLMEELDVGRDRPKQAVAWAAEKVGRLKLNGRFTEYSPLSRLIELEGLYLGITGKRELWRALDETLDVPGFDFEELGHRAERQRDALEPYRIQAARDAFDPIAAEEVAVAIE